MKTVPPTNHPVGPPDWRETPTHPLAADLFPLDDADAKPAKDLADSISRQGCLESIKRWQGLVIDGRRRFRACLALDIKPRFEDIDLADDEAALSAIVSLNHARRKQLTSVQRQALIAELRARGMTIGGIARSLHVAEATVRRAILKYTSDVSSGSMEVKFPKAIMRSDGKKYPTNQRQSWPDIWRLRAEGRTYAQIEQELGVGVNTIARALKAQKAAQAKAAAQQSAPSSQEQQPDQAEADEPTPFMHQQPKPDPSVWPSRAEVEEMADIQEIAKDFRPVLVDLVFEAFGHRIFEARTSTAQERAEAFADIFLEGAWKAIEKLKLPAKTTNKPTPIKPKPAKGKASDPHVLADLAVEVSYAMQYDPNDDPANTLSDQGAA